MIAAAANPISFLSGGNDIRRAMMWAIVFALCWAVLEIGLGSLLRNPYPLLQIVWCRYAVHLGVAAAIWAWRRPPMWQTERPAFQLARSLLMLTMPGAFAWAVMAGVSVEFVWAVFWIAPLLIVAFAGVALGERPPAAVLIAAVLGAVAAAAIFGHLSAASPMAIALAMAVSLSFSLYVVMTRSLRTEPVAANLFYTAVVPFLVLTPVTIQIGVMPSLQDAAVMASIGGRWVWRALRFGSGLPCSACLCKFRRTPHASCVRWPCVSDCRRTRRDAADCVWRRSDRCAGRCALDARGALGASFGASVVSCNAVAAR